MTLYSMLDDGLTRLVSITSVLYAVFGVKSDFSDPILLYEALNYIAKAPLPYSDDIIPLKVSKYVDRLGVTEEECFEMFDSFQVLLRSFFVPLKVHDLQYTKGEIQSYIEAVVGNVDCDLIGLYMSDLELAVMETLINSGFDGRGLRDNQRQVNTIKAWQQAHEFTQQMITDGGIQDFSLSTFQSGYTRHRAMCSVLVGGERLPFITPWCLTANSAKVIIARLLSKLYRSTFEHKVDRKVARVSSYLVRNDIRFLKQQVNDAIFILNNYNYDAGQQAFCADGIPVHELRSPYGAAQVAFSYIHARGGADMSMCLAERRMALGVHNLDYINYAQYKAVGVVDALKHVTRLVATQRKWRLEKGLEHFNKSPCLGFLARGRDAITQGNRSIAAHVSRSTETARCRLVDMLSGLPDGRHFFIIDWAGNIEVTPLLATLALCGMEGAVDVGLTQDKLEGRYMVMSRFHDEISPPILELSGYNPTSTFRQRYDQLYYRFSLHRYDFVHVVGGGIGSLKLQKIDTVRRAAEFIDSIDDRGDSIGLRGRLTQDLVVPDGCLHTVIDKECTQCKELVYTGAVIRRLMDKGFNFVKPRHAYGHNLHLSVDNFSKASLALTFNSIAKVSSLRNDMTVGKWVGKNFDEDFRGLMQEIRQGVYRDISNDVYKSNIGVPPDLALSDIL